MKDRRLRDGVENKKFLLNCITLLAVALTRLQHGIKENLSSVAYLT
ncbi:MAG: hypothetical protein KKG76_06265 [Euryarchaeota archaeon]|nr:hypothetical protein [Euryarchaeota archaeon]